MRVRQFPNSLSVALSEDHFDQIKQITDAEKISMAEWVRNAVDMALEKHKKDNENGFDKNRKGNELTVNPSDQYAQDQNCISSDGR